MPSRPWGSLGLWPRDPLRPGGHYFFTKNALAGILIIIPHLRHKLIILQSPFLVISSRVVVPVIGVIALVPHLRHKLIILQSPFLVISSRVVVLVIGVIALGVILEG